MRTHCTPKHTTHPQTIPLDCWHGLLLLQGVQLRLGRRLGRLGLCVLGVATAGPATHLELSHLSLNCTPKHTTHSQTAATDTRTNKKPARNKGQYRRATTYGLWALCSL